MRIGVNPVIWMNDDEPQLGADIPLERCLAEARTAGYSGIELGDRFPRTERELRPLLERHGLRLISGWWGARLLERGAGAELEAMRDHLALLRAMGCGTLVFAEVTGAVHRTDQPTSRRPTLSEHEWKTWARELERLAETLRERTSITLAYHHHVGTIVQTPEEIARLVGSTSASVGLLLDTGHLAYGSDRPDLLASLVARIAPRVVHVHLKDVRLRVLAEVRARDASFLEAVREGVFTVPGDGDLPLRAMLAPLTSRRYVGWLVIEAEQNPSRVHPLTYARLGHANAIRLLSEGALRRARGPRIVPASALAPLARVPQAPALRGRTTSARPPARRGRCAGALPRTPAETRSSRATRAAHDGHAPTGATRGTRSHRRPARS